MLVLYIRDACIHSRKVLDFAKEKHIAIDVRDIADDTHLLELKEYGGDIQTPYLYDSAMGVGMYESELIISYLLEYLKNVEHQQMAEAEAK